MRDDDVGSGSGRTSLVIGLEKRVSAKVRNGQHPLPLPRFGQPPFYWGLPWERRGRGREGDWSHHADMRR